MKKPKIFQELLKESFAAHKERTALEYGDERATYGRMDQMSDAVATAVLAENPGKETFIGIYTTNRLHLPAAVIGILKAGCVFVPLDPAHPRHRLELMAETAGLDFIIADGNQKEHFPGCMSASNPNLKILILDDILAAGGTPAALTYSPEDKIYVYFTSGTTGRPKAMVGKNKSLHHFIQWEIDTFSLKEGLRVSQWITPGFDAYLRDLFVPLCCGGTACIPENTDITLQPETIVKWTDEHNIGLIHCVPSLFRLLDAPMLTDAHFSKLKHILLSGEKVTPSHLAHWYEIFGDRVQLVNLYGPSETTMVKTFYPLSPADLTKERIPVGTPMKGCRVVILNEEQKVCDPLMAGEIFIRTPYMTHGYHNDEAMTKEKFITNPLSGNPQDIVFRTGDLGRLLADGNIEFLGRKDRQVKIRGIRVELEEIESALTAQPEVGSAAVMFREVSTDNRVVCAYILDGGGETPVDEHSVRTFAEKTLPDYMIPANIIIMDEFPRKPNGKVDYDSLPSPFDRDRTEYVAPQTPAHEKLMAIWQLVLGEGEYGIRDGFFQAGGNSLNVLTVSSLIHKEFQVKISMTDFFENDTIESLAKLVESMETDVYAAIEPAPEKSFYQVSSVQRRLFFLQQLDPENKSYNMPRIMMLEGDYDVSHLESTLTALIDRHESLRTSFRVEGDLPVQVVHAPGSVVFKGERKTLEMGEEVDLPTVHALVEEFIRPFDLTVAPLMRVAFVTVDAGRLIVMMDTHHIISDGVSQGVFISDFLALYKGKELEPLRIQYKDFSAWQNSEDQQERMARQENYWLKRYSEEVPLLQLPVDLERPNAQTFQGDAIHNAIAKEQLDSIHALALEEGATLYFVLLTLYNTLLGRLAGQEDVIVGSSLAGRRHSDLMGIIGMFVNALALRNYPAGEKTFRQFLVEVRDNTINDFDNQDYQFESLVEKAGIKRVPGRNPAFDVMMVLNNEDAPPVEIPDVKLSFLEFKKTSAQMDLKLRMLETPEGLGCLWEYSTSLFKKETMEMFASNFLKIVTQVLANPDIKLKDIQLTHGLQKSKVDTSMMDFDF